MRLSDYPDFRYCDFEFLGKSSNCQSRIARHSLLSIDQMPFHRLAQTQFLAAARRRVATPSGVEAPEHVVVQPQPVVRGCTGPAPTLAPR